MIIRFIKKGFNKAKNWGGKAIGINVIKPGYTMISDGIRNIIKLKPNKEQQADFEQYVMAHNITDEDLKILRKKFLLQEIVFLFLGLILFVYSCFSYFELSIFHIINYWMISLAFFLLAARANYYKYLILKRVLGIQFLEWFKAIIRGDM